MKIKIDNAHGLVEEVVPVQHAYEENLHAAACYIHKTASLHRPATHAALARALLNNHCCKVKSYQLVHPGALLPAVLPYLSSAPHLLQEVQSISQCWCQDQEADFDEFVDEAAKRAAHQLRRLPRGTFESMTWLQKVAWLCSNAYGVLFVEPDALVAAMMKNGLLETSAENRISYNEAIAEKMASSSHDHFCWDPLDCLGKALHEGALFVPIKLPHKVATQERCRMLRSDKSVICKRWCEAAIAALVSRAQVVKEHKPYSRKQHTNDLDTVHAASAFLSIEMSAGGSRQQALGIKLIFKVLGTKAACKAFRHKLEEVVREDLIRNFTPPHFQISNCAGIHGFGPSQQILEHKLQCGLQRSRESDTVIVHMCQHTKLSNQQVEYIVKLFAGTQEAALFKGEIPKGLVGRVIGRRARNLVRLKQRCPHVNVRIMHIDGMPKILGWPSLERFPAHVDADSDIFPPPPVKLSVQVQKPPCASFGITRKGDEVIGIKDGGPLADFNNSHPAHAIRLGDRVLSVNGVTGSKMFGPNGETQTSSLLNLEIERSQTPSEKSSLGKLKQTCEDARERIENVFNELIQDAQARRAPQR